MAVCSGVCMSSCVRMRRVLQFVCLVCFCLRHLHADLALSPCARLLVTVLRPEHPVGSLVDLCSVRVPLVCCCCGRHTPPPRSKCPDQATMVQCSLTGRRVRSALMCVYGAHACKLAFLYLSIRRDRRDQSRSTVMHARPCWFQELRGAPNLSGPAALHVSGASTGHTGAATTSRISLLQRQSPQTNTGAG